VTREGLLLSRGKDVDNPRESVKGNLFSSNYVTNLLEFKA
jgi:hypothetical protein